MKFELFPYVRKKVPHPCKPDESFTMLIPAITMDFDEKEQHPKAASVDLFYRGYEVNIRWPIQLQLQLHVSRYEVGCHLAEHRDYIRQDERQYRIQFILENAVRGGELLCERFIVNWRRFKIFEPGLFRHSVTKVEEGRRRLLNFGIRYAPKAGRPCPF
jgi:hypothetical protein